jgi:hypothetical protein
MISVSVDTSPLDRLNLALVEIEKLGKRKPSELVRRAIGDILFGASAANAEKTGGTAYSGLFAELRQIAPPKGEITTDRASDSWKVSSNSEDTKWAAAQADSILGSSKSGVFKVNYGSDGQMRKPQRVYHVYTKKSRVSELRAIGGKSRMKKSETYVAARAAMFNSGIRDHFKSQGYSQLNRQALIVVLTLARREASRKATAVQFLSREYKRLMAAAKRDGSWSAVAKNKKGTKLGGVNMRMAPGSAAGRISGLVGVAPQYMSLVNKVVDNVATDRIAYLARKLDKEVLDLLNGKKAS